MKHEESLSGRRHRSTVDERTCCLHYRTELQYSAEVAVICDGRHWNKKEKKAQEVVSNDCTVHHRDRLTVVATCCSRAKIINRELKFPRLIHVEEETFARRTISTFSSHILLRT